jgi:mannose-6-phosphate isomerase
MTPLKNMDSLTVLPTQTLAATELRPWGSFTILDEGPGYKIKRIEVNPGHRLSLQMHHHRSEHWIVISGIAKVTRDEEIIMLATNESTYVHRFATHRLENPGKVALVIIEVQNGEYLGEDDIVRFDDDYAR